MKFKHYLWMVLAGLAALAYRYDSCRELTIAAYGEPPKLKPNPRVLTQTMVAERVAPRSGNTTEIAPVLAEDPRKDLKTAIPDLVRRMRLGEWAWNDFVTPAEWAKRTPEEVEGMNQARLMMEQDPEMRKQMQKFNDAEAIAYEALENQTPAYNAAGDEATYSFHRPTPEDLVKGTLNQATPAETLKFIRIDGKWYFKPKGQEEEYVFPVLKMMQDLKKLTKPENGN